MRGVGCAVSRPKLFKQDVASRGTAPSGLQQYVSSVTKVARRACLPVVVQLTLPRSGSGGGGGRRESVHQHPISNLASTVPPTCKRNASSSWFLVRF